MLKKIISLCLIFGMLVPVSSAVAADDPSAPRSVEEILNEYHERAFAERHSAEDSGVSRNARGSTPADSMEQETVAELNAAGYEAYHVTDTNYDSLEETLHTDFGEMGLDPEGSYIVVISGEEPANQKSSRLGDLLLPPHTENEGGSGGNGDPNTFVHAYNGTVYTMRYINVTSDYDDQMTKCSKFDYDPHTPNEELMEFMEAVLWYAAEEDYGPLVGVYELVLELLDDGNYSESSIRAYSLLFKTGWDQQFIQVYDQDTNWWTSRQCSSVAISFAEVIFQARDVNSGQWRTVVVPLQSMYTYSPLYYQSLTRKNNAAIAHFMYDRSFDPTVDISFYYSPGPHYENIAENMENAIVLFTHKQNFVWFY